MGFFNQPSDPLRGQDAQPQLAPLSRDRVEQHLKSKDYKYFIDSDGDLGGNWNDNPFYFFIRGERNEILYVQSRWHHRLPATARADALELINDFGNRTFWPKVYLRDGEDGDIMLICELPVDLEHGVTDEQLGQFVTCALSTSLQFYREADARFGYGEN